MEEVQVEQPTAFKNFNYHNHVDKLDKDRCGLKQITIKLGLKDTVKFLWKTIFNGKN